MTDTSAGGLNKSGVQLYRFYKVEGGNRLNRLRRDCPRCGRGVFMAEHRDRITCGKCGFTEFHRTGIKNK